MTFMQGTGRRQALTPPIYLNKGRLRLFDAARATASETARIAFAPNADLFGVPSREIMAASILR